MLPLNQLVIFLFSLPCTNVPGATILAQALWQTLEKTESLLIGAHSQGFWAHFKYIMLFIIPLNFHCTIEILFFSFLFLNI